MQRITHTISTLMLSSAILTPSIAMDQDQQENREINKTSTEINILQSPDNFLGLLSNEKDMEENFISFEKLPQSVQQKYDSKKFNVVATWIKDSGLLNIFQSESLINNFFWCLGEYEINIIQNVLSKLKESNLLNLHRIDKEICSIVYLLKDYDAQKLQYILYKFR